MIKKLIINADDFGMCEGNSLGILLAHEEGLVSSTTVMMNMPYALWALDKAKAYPDLGIGVHLTLTAGKPLLPGKKSYTDEEGNFLRPSAYGGCGDDHRLRVGGGHHEYCSRRCRGDRAVCL